MLFVKNLFVERCPICSKVLETNKSFFFKTLVVKSCPNKHYQKEFHPALETYVETYKVS